MRRSSRINQFMVRRSFFIFFLFLSLVLSFPLTSEARTIQFINNCSQTIWFAFTGGSVKIPCGAGCPAGTVCNPADKLCYWANPLPPGGDTAAAFSIAGSGGTKTVTIPDSNQVTIPGSTTPQVWSGLIAGRTGCQSIDSGSQLKCMTANCPGNSGLSGFPQTTHGCFVGRGPEDAFNAAELTFQPTAPDFYDVTLINGINVPLQMEPVAGVTDPGNPYTCGIAAGLTPLSGSLSSCTWDLKPPMNDFIFVSPGGAKCSTDAGCTAPDLCGSSFNPVANGFEKSCGKFLGYWTATTLCSTNSGKGAPAYLKCNNPLPAADYPGAGADTMTQLFKCETPNAAAALLNSCYSFNSASCCGCSKWGVSPGTTGIVAPTVLGAVCLGTTFSTNFWVIGNSQLPSVLSQVAWLKRACPTSYAYQYDDKASTFQCPGTVSAPPANSQ